MRATDFVLSAGLVFSAALGCVSCGLFGGDDPPPPVPDPVPVPVPVPDPGPAPGPDESIRETGNRETGNRETGNCRNEYLEGKCTFLVASRAPGQSDRDPPGHSVYRVMHQIQPKGEDRKIKLVSAHLLVPDDRIEKLRKYYRKHSPIPCTAYIVRPPCNPQGTAVGLNLDPPPFAKVVRF